MFSDQERVGILNTLTGDGYITIKYLEYGVVFEFSVTCYLTALFRLNQSHQVGASNERGECPECSQTKSKVICQLELEI